MSENESALAGEQYELLLAACDEALATGETPGALSQAATPAELQPGMQRDLACIKLLRQWRGRDGPPAAPPIGAGPVRLGRFEIRRELGRGGFGVVFLAFDSQLRREVALKLPRPDVLVTPELRARFHQEARAAGGLDHANVVPVYEAGEIGAVCYIASAYCPGVTLAQWLKNHSEPVSGFEAAALLVKLAQAVQYAHCRGVLHRDLKPSNILLVSGGMVSGERCSDSSSLTTHDLPLTPKITDFGLAKLIGPEAQVLAAEHQTISGAFVGTPSYMAPEQAAGKSKDITSAVDVYALGAILYELMTGQPPFRAETALETLEEVRTCELLPPRRLRPQVARDLETICLKCLDKEPGRRYASAQALADDLHRYLRSEPILARPSSLGERARKWAKRRPAAAALIGVSVAALMALAAGGVWHVTQLRAALDLAEEREKETNQQWHRAEDNAAEAEHQRQRAELKYRQAADAVRLMLTRVSEGRLANMPHMEQVRRQLLVDALQFNLGLLKEKSDEPSMRSETARVYRQVGGIYHLLGEHRNAEEAGRCSLELYDGLVKDFPDKPEYRLELADTWNSLGDLFRDLARPEEAEQAIRQGLSILVKLSHDFPDVPAYMHMRANSCRNLGTLLLSFGPSMQCEQAFRDALALHQELVDRYPKVAAYQYDLANTFSCLGVTLIQMERIEEAEQALARALPLMEKSAAELGASQDYRYELAGVHNNLASLRINANRFQEAEKPCQDAITIQEKLVADFPKVPSYLCDLGGSYHNLLIVHTGLNRFTEAGKTFDKAYAIRRRLMTEFPGVADYQSDVASTLNVAAGAYKSVGQWAEARKLLEEAIGYELTSFKANNKGAKYRGRLYYHYKTLAECLVELGEHREAAKAAAEVARLYPDSGEAHHAAAQLLAFCATLAGKDAKLTFVERPVLVQTYANQAMEELRRVSAHGKLSADELRKVVVFEPLRSRNDFQQLLIELDRSSRGGK